MKRYPMVSVIFPVYNGMPYLREAINSLLNQTESNFKIIAVNNGSNDDSEKYLDSLNDDRIFIYNLPQPDLVGALNFGLEHANTPFIARMDTDDINHLQRIEKQVNFLINNPDVDILGTFAKYFGRNQKRAIPIYLPVEHEDIVNAMLKKRNCIIHPSIMFKSEILDEMNPVYNYNAFPCEDYEFFTKIAKYKKFANLPETLYYKRIHNNSIMSKNIKLSVTKYYFYVGYNMKNLIRNPSRPWKKIEKINIYLDTVSLSIYMKGLYYYFNKSIVVGYLFFFLSGFLNPIRLFNRLKLIVTNSKFLK